jgi:hypothetical protein
MPDKNTFIMIGIAVAVIVPLLVVLFFILTASFGGVRKEYEVAMDEDCNEVELPHTDPEKLAHTNKHLHYKHAPKQKTRVQASGIIYIDNTLFGISVSADGNLKYLGDAYLQKVAGRCVDKFNIKPGQKVAVPFSFTNRRD